MLKIGIIACGHGNGKATAKLCKKYEKQGADVIAMCGDLGDRFKEINSVLKGTSKAKVPVIAFPGSHEPVKDYYKALKKSRRIIDGITKRRITIKGYDLVTLPGSGSNPPCAGFRFLPSKKIPARLLSRRLKFFFVNDLAKYIRKPARTVMICHDPPKGRGTKAIDDAYFGLVKKGFILNPKDIRLLGKYAKKHKPRLLELIYEKGNIIPEPYAGRLAKKKYPVKMINENVGSEALKKILLKKKINYLVCGHIHESGQKAVNSSGKVLKQGEWSSSVWYNASPASAGKGGMLIIDGNKATYKNIRA